MNVPYKLKADLAELSDKEDRESLDLLMRLIAAGKDGGRAVDHIVAEVMAQSGGEMNEFLYFPAEVPVAGEFAGKDVISTDQQICRTCTIKGQSGGKSIILFAHPDVEPPGTGPAWSRDPFTPAVDNGKIYGWGVADDLSGIAAMLRVACLLKDKRLKGDLVLVSAPSKRHRRGIAAALNRGLEADAALYMHPAESGLGTDEIKAFSPGQLEFQITVEGRPPDTLEPAHTAFAHLAINPFEKAMLIADALVQAGARRGSTIHHKLLQKAIGRSANLMLTRCDFGSPETTSRIAAHCRLCGALSLVPGEELDTVMELIERAVLSSSNADPWLQSHRPKLEWLSGVSGAETAEARPLYQLVSAELRKLGANPKINPLHTASDIRVPIVQKGIPTIGFGPRCGGLAMSGFPDEWVEVDDYLRTISTGVAIAHRWCGEAPQPG